MSYYDSIVTLQTIEAQSSGCVSKQLLVSASPEFERLIAPAAGSLTPVELDVSDKDFRAFLWFLNANPLQFETYARSVDADARFMRSISIALVAGTFKATRIAEWAIVRIVEQLPHYQLVFTAVWNLCVLCANGCADIRVGPANERFAQIVHRVFLDAMKHAEDPIEWLDAVKAIPDSYLKGWAYFYILVRCPLQDIASDTRLTNLDRVRLTTGESHLRKYSAEIRTDAYRSSYADLSGLEVPTRLIATNVNTHGRSQSED
ncbi:hypothetical protein BKA62DRAFT_715300 [Auriculariales sp. MPI-PUGE-AT-0066]|nr:hypothetical protein BKA62DRAFT_715300 [Auriculariales sp. MPI-PUGE-AT-0066]